MASSGYQGQSAHSRKEARSYACSCGERFAVEVWRVVDARADPDAGRALVAGQLNHGRCPACAADHEVQVSVVFHDPINERLVLVLCDGLRHRELEERSLQYQRLAADGTPAPDYVRDFDVVFGTDELARLVKPAERTEGTVVTPIRALLDAALDAVNTAPPKTDPNLTPTPKVEEEATPAMGTVKPARIDEDSEGEDTGKHRAPILMSNTERAAVEKWIANREGTAAFLAEDKVLCCTSLRGVELDAMACQPLELRLQLHRMPTYPLAVLTVMASQAGGEDVVVHAPLDVARAAHRAVLEALARKASIVLHVYDQDYLAVVARTVAAPLEENAARLLKEAKEAFSRIAPAARSFDRARGTFLAPGYDRLGRIHVALSDVELGPLGSPCALRQAVATVSRWSEPGAEAYLAEVRSFPLALWRQRRTDVVRSAIEHGMHCPKALTQKVLSEANVAAEWSAVLKRQVAVFTEVALRMRPNDLSPDEEAENWRLLLAECQAAGVSLDPQVEQLARAAERRARAVASGAVDLRAFSTTELVAALDKKELRREAVALLAERRDPASLPAMFQALRRMTRAEANRVLPAITAFGEAAERYVVDNLRSRKSFVRQGCALALGTIGGPLAVESLARLLVEEPTEIWPEVARAVGDLGAPAVMPLAMRLRNATPEVRERVARAFAHILSRGVRGPVEMLAAGRDSASSAAARRALELEAEVREGDEEVRGGKPLREQTVVRSFSRRFFDALGGAVELDSDDLEELEEPEELLDEGDLLEEEVEPMAAELTDRHPRLPTKRNP
jgi:hypothetical protein